MSPVLEKAFRASLRASSIGTKHDIRQTRVEHQKHRSDLQRQMEQVQKAADAEMARLQRRFAAEMADVRATSSRLEVDLLKVRRFKPSTGGAFTAQDRVKY